MMIAVVRLRGRDTHEIGAAAAASQPARGDRARPPGRPFADSQGAPRAPARHARPDRKRRDQPQRNSVAPLRPVRRSPAPHHIATSWDCTGPARSREQTPKDADPACPGLRGRSRGRSGFRAVHRHLPPDPAGRRGARGDQRLADQHGYATWRLRLILLVVTMAARSGGRGGNGGLRRCRPATPFLIGDLPKVRRHPQRPTAVVHRCRGQTGRGLLARACRRAGADRLWRRLLNAPAVRRLSTLAAALTSSQRLTCGEVPPPAHPPRLATSDSGRKALLAGAIVDVLPLPGIALRLRSVEDLVGEALGHRAPPPLVLAGELHRPDQRTASVRRRSGIPPPAPDRWRL